MTPAVASEGATGSADGGRRRWLRPLLGHSLGQRLMLLFTVVLLPPTIVSGYLAWNAFSEQTKRAMLSVRQFTVLASTYERRFFQDTRERLERLAAEPAVGSGDRSECERLLVQAMQSNPGFASIVYYDPKGENVCGTSGGLQNAAGWPWFKTVAQFRGFTISDYTFMPEAQKPVIVAALAVTDESGQLQGVLSSSIDLSWLSSFFREVRLPSQGVFFLLDRYGNVLASSSSFGSTARPALPLAAARTNESSSLAAVVQPDLIQEVIARRIIDFEAVGQDKIRRVYSSVALPHGDVTMLFGMPADAAVGWIQRDLVMRLLSLAAIWVTGIGAAWLGTRRLVTRWTEALRDMAHGYGRGDYSAKLDFGGAPAELRDLGNTLMLMASRIEAREEDLRQSLGQKDMLLREIHHRVKNNLQIVSSLLNIHGSATARSSDRQALEEVKMRVRALALVHRYLYEGEDVQLVRLNPFMTELCHTLVKTLTARTRPIRLEVDVPELTVLSDRAVPIALFVTEVVTNALKHAFPNGRSGRITVRLAPEGDEHGWVLRIMDDGVGQTGETGADGAEPLGLRLMEAFAHQLGGDLSISSEQGTTVSLRLDVRALTTQGFSPGASAQEPRGTPANGSSGDTFKPQAEPPRAPGSPQARASGSA